jgi:hypothetical protein
MRRKGIFFPIEFEKRMRVDAHYLIKVYTCGCKELTFMDKEGRKEEVRTLLKDL